MFAQLQKYVSASSKVRSGQYKVRPRHKIRGFCFQSADLTHTDVEQLQFKDRASSETFVYNHHPTCHNPLVEFSYAVASKATLRNGCIAPTNHVLTVVTTTSYVHR